MTRTGWAVVVFAGLVVSYMACQNTWIGLKRDAQENTTIAKQKAKEAHLDEKARTAGTEVREAARKAGDGIKSAVSRLHKEEPKAGPTAAEHTAARDVNTAIGKVAAKAQEVG